MHVTPLTFLVVCPLVFLSGIVDAIAGGGALISIPAYLFAGLPMHSVIGTNKLSASMGSILAAYRYWKNGFVHWAIAAPCAVLALIGSAVGANISLLLNTRILKIILLVLLPLIAWYVLHKKEIDYHGEPRSPHVTLALSLLLALSIGVYDGMYGPGTGTFLMLLLTGLVHTSLNEAAGTTKIIALTTNITSLVVFLRGGVVLLALGLAAGVFSIAGNYIGTWLFTQRGASFVRPIILVVLVLFVLRLCSELFSGWFS